MPEKDILFTTRWDRIGTYAIEEDYWFIPYEPPGMASDMRAWRITRTLFHPVLLVLGFALFSCICSAFAGWMLFSDWRKMALSGLWNFTTIVGLSFALRHKDLSKDERRSFLVRFSVSFVAGSYMIQAALWWLIKTVSA